MLRKWFPLAGITLAVILFAAWKTPDSAKPVSSFSFHYVKDTTAPDRKLHKGMRDYHADELDNVMKGLDKAMIDLDKNLNIDVAKMNMELKLAMEEVKKIDFAKINQQVQASIQKIDWEKTKNEVAKAMHNAEIKLKEVDMKKIEADIARAKEKLNKEKIVAHIDMNNIRKEVSESLAKAKTGIEKAKKELTELKAFTNSLEKDGLIDKKKGYKIEVKDKKLFINGKEQPKEVNEKYSKYLDKEDFSISSEGESIAQITDIRQRRIADPFRHQQSGSY